MKVLHIITGLNVGGAENMLTKLLEASPDAAREAAVLSLLAPGPLAPRIRACGVRLESLQMQRGMPGPGDALRLARMVREIGPEVLHGWMYHGMLAASFAAFALPGRVPLIWNIRHSLADPARESRSTRLLLRLGAARSRRPDAIVYNADAALAQHSAFGFSAGRARVLPNGFDCQVYRPDPAARQRLGREFGIDPGVLLVGHVARLHPMKDHAMLVEAAALARAQGLDLHLVMIGAGLEDSPLDLRARIARLLPPGRVTLSGARGDISSLMPGFDLLALPSAWGEAFPNVLGEALACGVPAVATDVGDSARIVGDEGRIVAPGDPRAFAAALGELADLGAERRRELGLAGRRRIEQSYSIGAIANAYRQLHTEIAKRGQA
jgi:glycosyltransferase involved in cell wall biosynthesis